MSFNSFEYATVFMEELDSQLLDELPQAGWRKMRDRCSTTEVLR